DDPPGQPIAGPNRTTGPAAAPARAGRCRGAQFRAPVPGETAMRDVAILSVLIVVAGGAHAVHAQEGLPPLLRGVGIEQRLDEQVPLDLVFRDETGQAVRLGDYCGSKP